MIPEQGAIFATWFSLLRKNLVMNMALLIFKYILPIMLGYTLFVGLTGQYIPFMRPKALAKRPMWFLGLWTGAAVALVMSFGLQLAYRMDINDVDSLLVPGAWALAAAMLPGLIAYVWYRSKTKRLMTAHDDDRLADVVAQAESIDFDATLPNGDDVISQMDDTQLIEHAKIIDIDDQTTIWADMNEAEDIASGFDETQLFDIEPAQTEEPALFTDDANNDDTLALNAVSEDLDIDDTIVEDNQAIDIMAAQIQFEENRSIESDMQIEVDAIAAEEYIATELASTDSELLALATAEKTESMLALNELRENLEAEMKTRRELENHLRITRKGLGELESETRDFESKKAEALMELEQELEDRIKRTAAAEARAEREANKRSELEKQMVLVRQDALKATNECRVSVEARAKAMSTANRATTFARQAMQIRTRLETELHNAEAELDSKQNTISSLIKALEKEKARTQDDVASMAKQLRLHEKQLQARRTLEEVSRSVDNKLSTRLVKKVAKARG